MEENVICVKYFNEYYEGCGMEEYVICVDDLTL